MIVIQNDKTKNHPEGWFFVLLAIAIEEVSLE